jgi:hypothetical protein
VSSVTARRAQGRRRRASSSGPETVGRQGVTRTVEPAGENWEPGALASGSDLFATACLNRKLYVANPRVANRQRGFLFATPGVAFSPRRRPPLPAEPARPDRPGSTDFTDCTDRLGGIGAICGWPSGRWHNCGRVPIIRTSAKPAEQPGNQGWPRREREPARPPQADVFLADVGLRESGEADVSRGCSATGKKIPIERLLGACVAIAIAFALPPLVHWIAWTLLVSHLGSG